MMDYTAPTEPAHSASGTRNGLVHSGAGPGATGPSGRQSAGGSSGSGGSSEDRVHQQRHARSSISGGRRSLRRLLMLWPGMDLFQLTFHSCVHERAFGAWHARMLMRVRRQEGAGAWVCN